MRANILRGLASQAAKDSEFLRALRKDLEGTLIRYGYHLTAEEMRLVESLLGRSLPRETSATRDLMVARVGRVASSSEGN